MSSFYSREELVHMAVRVEKSAEGFYRAGARSFEELKTTFEHLAADEARHAQIYQGLLTGRASTYTSAEREAANRRVRGLVSVGLLDRLGAGMQLVKEAKDRTQLLEAAAGLEKDTILFYYAVLDLLEADDRSVVYKIIDSEHNHLAEVTSLLK